jgi:phage terminase large subunit GpA-like protein
MIILTALLTTLNPRATYEELRAMRERVRVPERRGLMEFAPKEIVVPKGKYKNLKFRFRTQPYVRLLYAAIDSAQWPRTVVVGCVQSGKTFSGSVVPTMHSLFELEEETVFGLPTMDMANDKWTKEILPAIRASRYKRLIPWRGRGSRGGTSNLESVQFRNGATLKFMSAHGGDEKRSGFTGRTLVITEVDKCDTAAASSRETDPVSQMEARLGSYTWRERRIFLECTVSVKQGRIWREYVAGTASRIVCPCPHCGEYVTPEREHLRGWQEAATKLEAAERAHFVCPACEHALSEHERTDMNLAAVLVHRGQTIDRDGKIQGDPPATDTLGFRWNAFNNLFWTPGDIGMKEWAAKRSEHAEEAEKELCQFYWVQPYAPPEFDLTPLEPEQIRLRVGRERRGIVPADATCLTMGVDLGKYVGWWVLMGWFESGSSLIVDYGTIEIPGASMDVAKAIERGLQTFRDECVMLGWQTSDGRTLLPDQVWVDTGYYSDAVYAFIRESRPRFMAVDGLGYGQHYRRRYSRPSKTGAEVVLIGDEYHVMWRPLHQVHVVEENVDHWKTWLHDRLRTPAEEPGAMRFYYDPDPNAHVALSQQLCAERPVEKFIEGRGLVKVWERKRRGGRKNHYLDDVAYASAAAHMCGVRLVAPPAPTARPAAAVTSPLRTPDGRPYLLTQR